MKISEIIKELENIHSERFLVSFHDDTDIIDAPDLKALGRSVKILRYLRAHKNETLSVARILSDCKIEV